MIGRITGVLVEKQPPQVVVEAAGVGYELDVPMSTLYHLPALGERVTLLTHLVVREDAHLLYGFASAKERSAFRALIRITGVGPRLALALLSGLNVDELAQAVALQETARLTQIPGIGRKTAERLLLELKGKLADALPQPGATRAGAADVGQDARHALLALGYSDQEASAALKSLPAGLSLEEAIRQALKALAKQR